MDEWTSNLIINKPKAEASFRQQAEAITEVFEECFVLGFEPLIEGLELPDKDDRHVLAAAIKCSAQVIVTENLRDFPNDVLEQYGVEALPAQRHEQWRKLA